MSDTARCNCQLMLTSSAGKKSVLLFWCSGKRTERTGLWDRGFKHINIAFVEMLVFFAKHD